MSIRLEKISKHYGAQVVVNNVTLEIKDGEFFVLLGASGSGKTTVLNIIAGLIQLESGKVLINDRDVTNLPTQERNVGFVFQNYALFQSMTVSKNIEFGLEVRKVDKVERQRKRDELLELVGLVGLGDRKPTQLSGGQQQRVALARALALKPTVLLLDEPLGALDAKIRVELRRSLKRIQRQSGVTTILVTHDQEEAFDLGDRIGVMNFGRLIEVGTPLELYQFPKSEFVASFLGSANLLLGQVRGEQVFIGANAFPAPEAIRKRTSQDRAQILFRPEDVAISKAKEELGCLPLGQGRIIEKGFSGPNENIRVEIPAIAGVRPISPAVPYGNPGFIMEVNRSAEQSTNLPIQTGGEVWVGIRRLHVLPHPGLNLLILTDGSLRSQSALVLGGYMARMAHAQVVLLGVGKDATKIEAHLQDARKQMGSGMASILSLVSDEILPKAVRQAGEKQFLDMVVMGWRPTAGLHEVEQVLLSGAHHLFLATEPTMHLNKALICLASGEPGKDTVNFAGRLLRHMGSEATLMTILSTQEKDNYPQNRVERFLQAGKNSLARFGVPATIKWTKGDLITEIQKECSQRDYDLIVLGAPLPEQRGQLSMSGVIGSILSSVQNCSFLIVQSRQYQRMQNPLRRLS
jgi:sulfate transport system ATP-binding protein